MVLGTGIVFEDVIPVILKEANQCVCGQTDLDLNLCYFRNLGQWVSSSVKFLTSQACSKNQMRSGCQVLSPEAGALKVLNKWQPLSLSLKYIFHPLIACSIDCCFKSANF